MDKIVVVLFSEYLLCITYGWYQKDLLYPTLYPKGNLYIDRFCFTIACLGAISIIPGILM